MPDTLHDPYDDERADGFYRSSMAKFPESARPPEDADRDAVIDAILAQYLESRMAQPRSNKQRTMAQVAFVQDYLAGTPDSVLLEEYSRELKMSYTQLWPKAREVGAGGVKAVSELIIESVRSPETTSVEDFAEFARQYEDLGDFIRRLYHRHSVSGRDAQAMILLFELEPSPASDEAVAFATRHVAQRIALRLITAEKRIPTNKRQESFFEEYLQGVRMLRDITGDERTGAGRQSITALIERVKLQVDDEALAAQYMYRRVGYALDILFPVD